NRQSLDRVVPNIAADKLQGMFAAAGWQVITLKYGQLLTELFARPGGDDLRERIDAMTNPEYQRLLRCDADELRRRLPGDGPGTAARLRRDSIPAQYSPALPVDIGRTPSGTTTTQAALGRLLLDLTRQAPDAARRVVTVSPDVSSTTNLGGWVNKVGVWSATE